MAILAVAVGGFRLKNDLRIEQACREWMNVRVLYNAGAYESGEREYVSLYPLLKERAAFLFEYGHGLHKLRRAEASNRIMREALKLSCDPMILNIMGKNYQQKEIIWRQRNVLSVLPIVCRGEYILIICWLNFMQNRHLDNRTSLRR